MLNQSSLLTVLTLGEFYGVNKQTLHLIVVLNKMQQNLLCFSLTCISQFVL